ncbi:hypothetical protein [Wohlfahrtiimonas chitiniclastica]|uniref:hypothetical protein n=1 Tax=Wohlfahrtiimonas chitiniclastica TaxID=400946 RepID=UPI00117CE157|nr:hypothetical protein [Wohlfahrtiimonas chitiniclastica]MBS7815897.1 hypothetical protein [Wohlfahrtiimonas chitiniclastica]MBS7822108.1 hypothetical protein [Wohlfahrtiimonas chitiniclastica]MBS7829900.1 hypothetical protein [Wohlfahrtiimonas chitiniclastica]MBS7831867.1 hypothetical protein [Wohlfahrtiimonas chitiniclastica]
MSQMYGELWTNSFGEIASENMAWKAGLSGLTAKQVMMGLEKVAQSGKTFPPTLPEFLAHCKDERFDFDVMYQTCVYWSSESALKQLGLKRSREALFIMSMIGGEIQSATQAKAEMLVRKGIAALEKHLNAGGQLPEFAVEIEHKPLPKQGFSLTEFMRIAANSPVTN